MNIYLDTRVTGNLNDGYPPENINNTTLDPFKIKHGCTDEEEFVTHLVSAYESKAGLLTVFEHAVRVWSNWEFLTVDRKRGRKHRRCGYTGTI